MVQLAVDHKDAAKAIDRGQDHTQREGRVAPTQRRRVATGLILPAAQPEARAFVRQLARHGVPYYWDSRVTEPTGIPYHTWTYWRDSAHDALIRLSALFLAQWAQADLSGHGLQRSALHVGVTDGATIRPRPSR